MSKYADKTEPELVMLVAERQGVGPLDAVEISDCGGLLFSNGKVYNPLQNPTDAWPIILEAEISLIRDVSTNDVWEAVPKGWHTENGFISNVNGDLCFIDKNPLRAAMIVYLMMEDEA